MSKIALILCILASTCGAWVLLSSAQQQIGPITAAPAPQRQGTYPIVVLPQGRGFSNLQDALDFCAATPSTPSTVLLEAGTYTGNFTLPAVGTTWLVGRAGVGATTIEGQLGVNQPVLSFSPVTGPASTTAALFGLQVRGAAQAVVDYSGSASGAQLMLQDCYILAQGSIPGIRMTGGGHDGSNRLEMELNDSWLESQGDGVTAQLGSYAGIHCSETSVHASSYGIDMVGLAGSLDTSLHILGGQVESQDALRMLNMEHLQCASAKMRATQLVANLDDVALAKFARSDLLSQGSDVIQVSGTDVYLEYMQLDTGGNPSSYGLRALSSSDAYAAYCGFSTAGTSASSNNAIYTDASSNATSVLGHWVFNQMP